MIETGDTATDIFTADPASENGRVELQVTTNFSFLRGASHPEEMVEQAIALGYSAIAITDRNTLAGIVRAHAAAKKRGIRIIIGCRLDLLDGYSLLAYPTNKASYSRLSNLLSTGNLRAEKGECHLYKKDVYDYKEGLLFIAIPPDQLTPSFELEQRFQNDLLEYAQQFGSMLYLAASKRYNGDDNKFLYQLAQLSTSLGIPLIATNDVHYHIASARQLQDIVTCIREKTNIYEAGFLLHPNAERHLKPPNEICRLFRQYPYALANAIAFASECCFSLDELKYEYPEEITTEGRTPQEEIAHLAWQGAHNRYGRELPQAVVSNIRHELTFIEEMNYAAYFLTVYDIVRFAREKNILCQGRGSAANSTICYCLGITAVDPTKFDLLFERFISSARNEPPDIDVDFEHERREEVIQYIYKKYGRDRAAIVATVTQQHQKGSIKDVGKAMGLSVDTINRISGAIWSFSDEMFEGGMLKEQGLDPTDTHLLKVLELTQKFMGFPRQLGQHTGGFVITKGKLSDLCPIMNARMQDRTCIEWNKDDIDALGFMKIDVLALGMLTCVRKAFELASAHYGLALTLANIPQDDPGVYEMICRADTIGVFQIESRAQQSMLPRLRPTEFYDLVIEVAIVRPGPIQGDMVHPYLRRRNKEEEVEYPSPELYEILKRTLGVPLFQEQAMKIAIVAAGFTPAEADELRRSMATFKVHGMVTRFHEKLVSGMMERGYQKDYAERVFRQLEGFGSYGFPESHAASFALLVYISSWLKCYYPDVFCCAILNSLPMGFYQPAQLIDDARQHGVVMRAIDINHSYWDNSLEEKEGKYCTVRLGFRQVKGLRAEDMELLVSVRLDRSEAQKHGNVFTSINDLRDIGLPEAALEKLAEADAFRSMGLDRRQALWEVSARDRSVGVFTGQLPPEAKGEKVRLPRMLDSEHVVHDYAATSVSLKAHPVSFIRAQLAQLRITPNKELAAAKDGDMVKVAGLVLVRQRPGTAKGVCFMTIEDETGYANLVVFEKIFDQFRKEILQARLIMAEGKLQVEGEVIHVIVQKCYNISKLLRRLTPAETAEPDVLTLARPDETSIPTHAQTNDVKWKMMTEEEKVFYKGRNFR